MATTPSRLPLHRKQQYATCDFTTNQFGDPRLPQQIPHDSISISFVNIHDPKHDQNYVNN